MVVMGILLSTILAASLPDGWNGPCKEDPIVNYNNPGWVRPVSCRGGSEQMGRPDGIAYTIGPVGSWP